MSRLSLLVTGLAAVSSTATTVTQTAVTTNVALLQDKNNLLAIMKDGRFHKAP